MRPGRFDLKIKVNLPNEKERLEILNYYLNNKKHDLDENYLKDIVSRVKGWSGAHLENLANEQEKIKLYNLIFVCTHTIDIVFMFIHHICTMYIY